MQKQYAYPVKKSIQLFAILTVFVLTSWTNPQINNKSGNLTDKNRTKQGEAKEKRELKTCVDVVMGILMTSPTFLKETKGLNEAIVKNGGTSFGITIEGSPNPQNDGALDYSKTYDFNLHETYSARMPVIARFIFNQANRQLYE
jgi:hypothetical protein